MKKYGQLYYRDSNFNEIRVSLMKLLTIPFIIVFLLGVTLSFTTTVKINNFLEKIPILIKKNETFSPEEVKDYIIKCNIQHPDIVYKQCLIESGNFKSQIFKLNNNCLGMKEPKQRITTALGTQLNHAYYDNWKDCIIDYGLWQASYARNLSKEEYLSFLGQVYAEDPDYLKKISK